MKNNKEIYGQKYFELQKTGVIVIKYVESPC